MAYELGRHVERITIPPLTGGLHCSEQVEVATGLIVPPLTGGLHCGAAAVAMLGAMSTASSSPLIGQAALPGGGVIPR
jgi:hypothetical protein